MACLFRHAPRSARRVVVPFELAGECEKRSHALTRTGAWTPDVAPQPGEPRVGGPLAPVAAGRRKRPLECYRAGQQLAGAGRQRALPPQRHLHGRQSLHHRR